MAMIYVFDPFTDGYIMMSLIKAKEDDTDPANIDMYPKETADESLAPYIPLIHPDTLARMIADCADFQAAHQHDLPMLANDVTNKEYADEEAYYAGFQYFLTRNDMDDSGLEPFYCWERAAQSNMVGTALTAGIFSLSIDNYGLLHSEE